MSDDYVIYARVNDDGTHTVRLYRDQNGDHIHSWEGCYGLDSTMRDVAKHMRERERQEANR